MSFRNYISFRERNDNKGLDGIYNKQTNYLTNNFPLNSNYNFNNELYKNQYTFNNNYYDDFEDKEEKKNENDNYDYSYKKEQKDLGNQYEISNKVIDDFKNIMEQTKIIKNKILLKSKDIENNIFNNSYFESKTNNFYNTTEKNYYNTSNNNNTNNFELELDDYLVNDSNISNIDKKESYLYTTNSININGNLKEKLKSRNKLLSNMNSKIILQNNLLESEISLYEKKHNKNNKLQKPQFNNNADNIFYQSLNKFIINLKSSLKNNIESNQDLGEKLIAELIKYNELNDNNIKQKNRFDGLKIKLQKQKEIINNIKKYNTENNKRYLYLKDEHNKLSKTAERLKLNLLDLKSKEKNLSLKKDTNQKNNLNYKEIILALQKTIHNLKNENISNNKININKNKNLNINKNSLNLFNDKLNQLYSIVDNIKNEKNIISEENMKMKNEIEKKRNLGMVGENKKIVKENELKVELNELKLDNYNIEKQIKEKDELIKKMKNIIKQYTSDVNNDENEYDEIKKQIYLLIKPEVNEAQIEKQLNNDKLSKEINEKLNLDIKLNEQIKSEKKKYDDIINNKDKEILKLEKKIENKENQKKNVKDFPLKKEEKIEKDNNDDIKNQNEEYEDNYKNIDELVEMENQDYIEEQDEENNPEENSVEVNNYKNYNYESIEEDEKEENLEEFYQNKNYEGKNIEHDINDQ